MRKLKKIVSGQLKVIAAIMVVFILLFFLWIEMENEHRSSKQSSLAMFNQVEQLLHENQLELNEIEEEFTQTCLRDAEAIAYIIQYNPHALESVDEMKKIASLIGVDEIHIFDKTGRIFMGTHPEYFNYTFDSGEQIGFFKPMLYDKELKLVQEITPNTAEGKMIQYAALWSENGEFIVQVGMDPVNVLKLTEKNQLSYVFALLRVNVGVELYAVDKESGEIVGATNVGQTGKNITEIGLDMDSVVNGKDGFHTDVNGVYSYCVFIEMGNNYIGRVVTNTELHPKVYTSLTEIAIGIILIVIIMVLAVTWCINRFVISDIYKINDKLRVIADGNLDEDIDIRSCVEFSELSRHINDMKKSVLASTDKISYVLNQTNMHIGVYEYSEKMKKVRFTEYVPKVLGLDESESERLFSDYRLFKEFIKELHSNPVRDDETIFRVDGYKERYVKLEEITQNNETLGIVMDVTEDLVTRKRIEAERDIDMLTGLYNRRGLENRLAELFETPDALGYGALIMIDADGLKKINDEQGHEMGDAYLKKISEAISSVDAKSSVAARQGGDEFVLFLYDFDREEEVLDCIDKLKYIQNNTVTQLSDTVTVPMKFSIGYSLTKGRHDYQNMLKQADVKMYANKRERKKSDNAKGGTGKKD